MTELNQMQREMIETHNVLSFTAVRTKNKFDERMRATVKELLGYRYALETKPIEETAEASEFRGHWENAIRLGNALFGGNSKEIQFWKNNAEWNRNRPIRIYDYVQKIVDIFPAEHLTRLLYSSKNLTAEELISLYEANKGEAKQNDYGGIPTGIDQNQLMVKATFVHKF